MKNIKITKVKDDYFVSAKISDRYKVIYQVEKQPDYILVKKVYRLLTDYPKYKAIENIKRMYGNAFINSMYKLINKEG